MKKPKMLNLPVGNLSKSKPEPFAYVTWYSSRALFTLLSSNRLLGVKLQKYLMP